MNYSKQELLDLYNKPLSELLDMSHKITEENFDNTVEACSIISAKTGACSENCKYCAQSKHNNTNIECHPLMDVQTVKKAALSAKENGANHFCIVTSGTKTTAPAFNSLETLILLTKAHFSAFISYFFAIDSAVSPFFLTV